MPPVSSSGDNVNVALFALRSAQTTFKISFVVLHFFNFFFKSFNSLKPSIAFFEALRASESPQRVFIGSSNAANASSNSGILVLSMLEWYKKMTIYCDDDKEDDDIWRYNMEERDMKS